MRGPRAGLGLDAEAAPEVVDIGRARPVGDQRDPVDRSGAGSGSSHASPRPFQISLPALRARRPCSGGARSSSRMSASRKNTSRSRSERVVVDQARDADAAAHGGDEVALVQLGDASAEPLLPVVLGLGSSRLRLGSGSGSRLRLGERRQDDRGDRLGALGDGEIVEVGPAVRLAERRARRQSRRPPRPPCVAKCRPGLSIGSVVSRSSSAAMTICAVGQLARGWLAPPARGCRHRMRRPRTGRWPRGSMAPVAKPSAMTMRSPGSPMTNMQPRLRPPGMNSLPPSASIVCSDQIVAVGVATSRAPADLGRRSWRRAAGPACGPGRGDRPAPADSLPTASRRPRRLPSAAWPASRSRRFRSASISRISLARSKSLSGAPLAFQVSLMPRFQQPNDPGRSAVEVQRVVAVLAALPVALDVEPVQAAVADRRALEDDAALRHGGLERGDGVLGRVHQNRPAGLGGRAAGGRTPRPTGPRMEAAPWRAGLHSGAAALGKPSAGACLRVWRTQQHAVAGLADQRDVGPGDRQREGDDAGAHRAWPPRPARLTMQPANLWGTRNRWASQAAAYSDADKVEFWIDRRETGYHAADRPQASRAAAPPPPGRRSHVRAWLRRPRRSLRASSSHVRRSATR